MASTQSAPTEREPARPPFWWRCATTTTTGGPLGAWALNSYLDLVCKRAIDGRSCTRESLANWHDVEAKMASTVNARKISSRRASGATARPATESVAFANGRGTVQRTVGERSCRRCLVSRSLPLVYLTPCSGHWKQYGVSWPCAGCSRRVYIHSWIRSRRCAHTVETYVSRGGHYVAYVLLAAHLLKDLAPRISGLMRRAVSISHSLKSCSADTRAVVHLCAWATMCDLAMSLIRDEAEAPLLES